MNSYIFGDQKYGDQFASFSPDDMAGKRKLYSAINAPDSRIVDHINQVIRLTDVVISRVEIAEKMVKNTPFNDDDIGVNKRGAFRVILIDAGGHSYVATSNGIYNSICTLRNVFGTLHFDEPMELMVKQISTKNGNTLTLALV